MNHVLFADVGRVSNDAVGSWVLIMLVVFAGISSIVSVISLFATRREVDKIDARLTRVEDGYAGLALTATKELAALGQTIRSEIAAQKDALFLSAEKRSSVLHNRMNPIAVNLAELKGGQEAFVKAFDNFTEVMKELLSRTPAAPEASGTHKQS